MLVVIAFLKKEPVVHAVRILLLGAWCSFLEALSTLAALHHQGNVRRWRRLRGGNRPEFAFSVPYSKALCAKCEFGVSWPTGKKHLKIRKCKWENKIVLEIFRESLRLRETPRSDLGKKIINLFFNVMIGLDVGLFKQQ